MKLLNFFEWIRVNESYLINEDFKTQTVKYVSQGYQNDEIKKYLDEFRELRDKKYSELFKTPSEEILQIGARSEITDERIKNFPVGQDRINIDKYREFDDVVAVINWISSIKNFGFANFNQIKVDGETVFENEEVAIYHAKNKYACIEYKGDKTYSWCIARSDSQNAFNAYRHGKWVVTEPSFYFVKRKRATKIEFSKQYSGHIEGKFIDKWHLFVILVANRAESNEYAVTSADNDGDTKMEWSEILKIAPELQGLESYFIYTPVSKEEKEKYDKARNSTLSDEAFMKLSYSDKEYYLDVNNTKLSDNKFLNLPKDLKKKYINQFTDISDVQFESIKKDKDLLKRYTELVNRKFENLSKNDKALSQIKIAYGEYSVMDNRFKPSINEEILKSTKSFIKNFLYNKNGEKISTSKEFKDAIEYQYAPLLWKDFENMWHSELFIPKFNKIIKLSDFPNFLILADSENLKKEVDFELDKNPYAKDYIGIYLYLTKNIDLFNNYLKFLEIDESRFFNGLTEDDSYIASYASSGSKIKGKKEDKYRILHPENGEIISYYPDINVKASGKSDWKLFTYGHTDINFNEKNFRFDFDEFKYNNIKEFIDDWGFRLVYKTDIGKYLEENPKIIVRVTKDPYHNSAIKYIGLY